VKQPHELGCTLEIEMYEKGHITAGGSAIGAQACGQYANPARSLDQSDLRGVQQAMNRLRSVTNEIGICVDSIGKRLDPVMSASMPAPAQTMVGSPIGPGACAVSVEISSIVDDLGRMAEAIRSYMQRLEV
jgi:hypothetical protein